MRFMFHDIDGRSGRDPSEHLGNSGMLLSSGRSTSTGSNSNKDEYDEFTEDYVAGERLPVTGTNLSHQAGASGVDPALRDTDSGKVYQPRDVPEDDYPPLKSRGNSLREGKPSDGRKLVASFDTKQARYVYFSQPGPGTWTLFRRDMRDGKSSQAERVQTFSTFGGAAYYVLDRHGNEVRIFRTDAAVLDPGKTNGVAPGQRAFRSEIAKGPTLTNADAEAQGLRADMCHDAIKQINALNQAHYDKRVGNVPRRKSGSASK